MVINTYRRPQGGLGEGTPLLSLALDVLPMNSEIDREVGDGHQLRYILLPWRSITV